MNIDELKSNWQSIDFTTPQQEQARETERRVAENGVKSLCGRYHAICLRMTVLSAVGILTFIPFAKSAPILVCAAVAFFIIMAILHMWQAIYVNKINLGSMTMMQAIDAVCKLERMRIVKRSIGICLAVPLLCYGFFVLSDAYGPVMLAGCLSGALIGLILGLLINRRISSILSQMKERLGV
ncbi:MAG: hypothetical protein NC039_07860 [Muribaculaceae bacterium]|nr:hypothetical protein [Muribaculaceae bacterium]